MLMNGYSSPIHQTNYTKIEPAPINITQPTKTDTNLQIPLTCIRTEPSIVVPLKGKNNPSVVKTEVAATPSCIIKKEPITIQPCSLVKPLPNLPAGHVQKITIQNGQQPKLIPQAKGIEKSSLHPWDQNLVSMIASVHNNGRLIQSFLNCSFIELGICILSVIVRCP